MKTLLQLVQDACREIALQVPTTVASNTGTQEQQLLAYANREGKELSAHTGLVDGWPALRKEFTVTLVAATESYALPSDYQYFIPRTGWDRTRKWMMAGPATPQEWQFLKSGYPGSAFQYRYRIMGGRMHFDPAPTAAGTVVFEYYGKNWVLATDGTTEKEYFTADTDTPILDDYLITLGLKWRFLRAKGMSYDQEYNDYQDAVERAVGRAADARTLNLGTSQRGWFKFQDGTNIPDTGIGT